MTAAKKLLKEAEEITAMADDLRVKGHTRASLVFALLAAQRIQAAKLFERDTDQP